MAEDNQTRVLEEILQQKMTIDFPFMKHSITSAGNHITSSWFTLPPLSCEVLKRMYKACNESQMERVRWELLRLLGVVGV